MIALSRQAVASMLCKDIYGELLFAWILAPFDVPVPLHDSTYIFDLTVSVIVTKPLKRAGN